MSHAYVTLDYQRPDHWSDQANCKGKAYELFEYQEKDSPLTEGMSFRERIEFNDANFFLAGEICIECPVMLTCLAEATSDEKYWTVRGGEVPGRFVAQMTAYKNKGRPIGSKNKLPAPKLEPGDRVCTHGHLVKNGGRCKECKRASNARRMRESRAKSKDQVA